MLSTHDAGSKAERRRAANKQYQAKRWRISKQRRDAEMQQHAIAVMAFAEGRLTIPHMPSPPLPPLPPWPTIPITNITPFYMPPPQPVSTLAISLPVVHAVQSTLSSTISQHHLSHVAAGSEIVVTTSQHTPLTPSELQRDEGEAAVAPLPTTPQPSSPHPPSPQHPSPKSALSSLPTASIPSAARMRTRQFKREACTLMCSCGGGVSYEAARTTVEEERSRLALGEPRVAISRLEAVPELARSYVERGWVESRCEQAKLEAHFEKLRGAWRAPPGVVSRDLINAADSVDSSERYDMQFESHEGKLKNMVPLEDLKAARDAKFAQSQQAEHRKGYRRPNRLHRGMAHACHHHHAHLDFYGKSWIRGCRTESGVSNADLLAHCLEMRHLTVAHFALAEHLVEVFWPVLNEASRKAVYNCCVVMDSVGDEFVNWHSDTLASSEEKQAEMPYVEGAAVLVVMKGMRQLLHTRALAHGPFFSGKKDYDFPSLGVPAIDLEDGCAYMIPAGEVGSVDWLVEHMTYPHVLGPGSEWEGVDKPRRRAWVFRAIKPEHAQWYSQEWPHRMCPPSHAAKLYGERVGGPENVWG